MMLRPSSGSFTLRSASFTCSSLGGGSANGEAWSAGSASVVGDSWSLAEDRRARTRGASEAALRRLSALGSTLGMRLVTRGCALAESRERLYIIPTSAYVIPRILSHDGPRHPRVA